MGKLFYLGHYSEPGKRAVFLTAQTMMDYVIGAINEADKKLTVITAASLPDGRKLSSEHSVINEKTDIIYLACAKRTAKKNIFLKLIQKTKQERLLYKQLKKLISDGDTLLVYHSLAFSKVLKKLRKKKKFTLVIQVCEIYADASINNKINREKELLQIALADKYIFSSSILEKELNKENKPYTICMGTYRSEPNLVKPLNDGKIHIVYSGTFNMNKGGVFNALEAAKYLDNNYYLHILGKGNKEIMALFDRKAREAVELSDCTISYEGYHSGDKYKARLQRCKIGLSTQSPNAKFNNTSFPSKILSYMSNGLRVISADILPVKSSTLGEYITYYNGNDPRAIADAIRSIDLNSDIDLRAVVDTHNSNFVSDLKKLL